MIDVATNTLYVTTFGKPDPGSPNTQRNNMLWVLDTATLADKKPPVLITGNADNRPGSFPPTDGTTYGGNTDAFVAKIDPNGTLLRAGFFGSSAFVAPW